jgi:beta-glucanase (GH16 family)
MINKKTFRVRVLTLLCSGMLAIPIVFADVPPKSGELFDAAKANIAAIDTENTKVSWSGEGAAKTLQAEFPAGNGYPAFSFPIPGGSWDLSAYAGVQVDVTNTGAQSATISLRVDNAGDWKKQPWNTEAISVKAGETKTVKVYFGKSYGGGPGYALDPKAVTAIKVFAVNPKAPITVTLKNLKAFGTTPTVATPVTVATTTTNTAGPIFDIAKADASAFRTDGDTSVSIVDQDGAKVVQAKFVGGNGYPSLDFPTPAEGWKMAGTAGVQVELTNKSAGSINVAMRLDELGNYQKSNTESVTLGAGQTKTLKVTFGKSFGGGPGYKIDPAKITNIKLFANNPKQETIVQIKNLQTFGTAESSASATTEQAAPALKAGLMSPPISGELLVIDSKTVPTSFQSQGSTVTIEDGTLKTVFNGGKGYPNLRFPIPKGGWNLSSFGGIQVEVTNPGASPVRTFLRVDNPGDWKKEPWNTEWLTIPAGQTKTLKMIFGEQNGAPAYPLDSNNINSIQVFLENPKQETTLLFKDLRAYGSPRPRASNLSFSKPEDRNVPVVPAAWVGSKPPVDGNWVQTLNENFDGSKLNDKIWREQTWWHGMLPGQTQRYSSDQLIFENGVLKMKTEKKRGYQYDNPELHKQPDGKVLPQLDYVSGHIITYDKWTQLYGYFEARIKLPKARGLWPAFWMMPDRGPAAGPEGWKRESTSDGGMEIDILEHLTEWGPGRNNVAVHWDGYGEKHKSWGTSDIYYGPTADGWHTYGVLWEPGKLTWYIDGIKKSEFAHERVGSVPAYLLLNVQMGSWATKDVDVAALPDYYQIDWVRAWQLKDRVKN